MKHTCSECKQPRKNTRKVLQEVNGWVQRVCQQCWERLNYDLYMYPEEQ